jgi:chitin disaccharide deacetylase
VKRQLTRAEPLQGVSEAAPNGLLIVNADDWGRDAHTTGCILDCVVRQAVSSVSAMVFMEHSDRAAAIALERNIDAGLHLNFTSPFTARACPPGLAERHRQIAVYLRRHRLAQLVFNPALVKSFQYVAATQVDEYRRLYGADPVRLDGHHHMHLCANVLLGGLLPPGTLVRRNFSFQSGEKGLLNRSYRGVVDRLLARRHRLADYLFALVPFDPPGRLQRIVALAREHVVEVETHPVQPDEYRFLAGGEIFRLTGDLRIAPPRPSTGAPSGDRLRLVKRSAEN